MTKGQSWEDNQAAAHLTAIERRCASHFLKVRPDEVQGPLTGLLVGECPGVNTRSYLPLFPYPTNSAGGRLLKYSAMTPGQYLGRLRRTNFYEHHQLRWPGLRSTNVRALELHEEFAQGAQRRVVLLGSKVGRAFGFDAFWQMSEKDEVEYVVIPHPSGLSRVYNDPKARVAARAAVQWAADYMMEFVLP